MLRKAAFFDRDGTINVDYGHVYRPEQLRFVDGTPELIRAYNQQNIPVLVVTNQAGIAKGLYTKEEMDIFHAYMNERLRKEYGAHIDAFYYCPHHPDYTGHCDCRKPAPGMLLRAAKEWEIDLGQSVMYGDKEKDQEAARRAQVGKFQWIQKDGVSHVGLE